MKTIMYLNHVVQIENDLDTLLILREPVGSEGNSSDSQFVRLHNIYCKAYSKIASAYHTIQLGFTIGSM